MTEPRFLSLVMFSVSCVRALSRVAGFSQSMFQPHEVGPQVLDPAQERPRVVSPEGPGGTIGGLAVHADPPEEDGLSVEEDPGPSRLHAPEADPVPHHVGAGPDLDVVEPRVVW
jgi:hypothetical protein